ncbi:MAG: hypothetical protein HKN12_00715 [Gemmatimonadetes bacterium]|nr:hypothetical protein [Gemmatimonadota bacterium]
MVVPFALPLMEPGWLQSHEGLSYPQRLMQVARCWADGMISARWFPDFNNGQGYPFLSFYAPFLFFAAGLLHTAGASLTLALKIPVLFGALAGAAGAYRLTRLGAGPAGALVAAVLYTYAPYRLRDIFIRGDLTEYIATGMLPWALFALIRLGHSREIRDVLLVVLTGSLAILTHNILGMFTGVMMLVTTLWTMAFTPQRIRTGVAAAIGGIGTLWLTAFFWASALFEKKFVQIEEMTTGVLAIERNFIAPSRLIGPAEYPGVSQDLPMSFELGWPVLGCLLLAPLAFRGASPRRKTLLGVAFTALLSGAFLSTTASAPVYDALPLLQFVQFPWRYLSLVSLGAAVLGGLGIGALLDAILRTGPDRRRDALRAAAVGLIGILTVVSAAPLLGPKRNVPVPDWAVDPEEIAKRIVTATSSGEYLPVTVTEREIARGFRDGIKVLGDAEVQDAVRSVGRYAFTAVAAEPVTVVLRDVHYPGWRATVNGEPHAIGPRERSGQLEMALPAGRHEVRVSLHATPFRRGAYATSLVALAVALGALVVSWFRTRNPTGGS